MQDLPARADGAPDHFTQVLVDRDQTWGARRWDARVAFILPVGGRDHQQITHGQHVAIGGFMRKDTQAATHVQLPDDVGRRVVLEDLLPIRTSVLAVAETLRVEGTELALGGDIEQSVPFHIRRTCCRRQHELLQAALHFRGHVLPKERAIRRPEGHEHAALFLKVGVHVPGVVDTHIDGIAGNHGRPYVSFPN